MIETAKENYQVELSTAQASEILANIIRRHDASIGINWDVIDYWVGDYIEKEGIEATLESS